MRFVLFIAVLFVFDSLLRFVLLCLRLIRPAKQLTSIDGAIRGSVILIAAHDEAGTIGPTIAALHVAIAEWPKSSLWVVADRCTDGTAEEAAVAGANVAKRQDGRLGKGAVIAWWLQHHEEI